VASRKILVIDDSKVIQRMVKDMLPTGNFEVLQALDGEVGLKMIRAQNPDLIMLDFLLPKVSGWEVFQQLEKVAKAKGKFTPLVLMSGRKEEVVEKIAEPFEYFEFIEKPFEQKKLIVAIKSAMNKSIGWPGGVPKDGKPGGVQPKPSPSSGGDAEIVALKKQIVKMQGEINTLKKQLTQVVTLIKQKLK
jgi:DNA-binding response OmpR family regulator